MSPYVLASVVCVIALVGGSAAQTTGPPPSYVNQVAKVKAAFQKLKDLTPLHKDDFPDDDFDLTDPEAHYAQLLSVVDQVASTLSLACGPTYDHYYYKGVKVGVTKALSSAASVVDEVLTKVENAKGTFQVFVDLVDKLCPEHRLGCDYAVLEELENSKELYQKPYQNFLLALNVSQLYLDNTYEEEAKQHAVLKLLVEGKDKLEGLVLAVRNFKLANLGLTEAVACP